MNARRRKKNSCIELNIRIRKSFIARQFAQAEYKTYLIIALSQIFLEVKDIFLHDRHNLEAFFLLLQTY